MLTVDEYLELEEGSSIKHAYVEGMLYAMAGSTLRHNRISLRIASLLMDAADGSPCQVYMRDVKCQVGNVFYYPDVMVACGDPDTDNPNPVYRTDPCLLVYRQIPTVRAYLIVDQYTRHVERHYRDIDGLWQRADHLNDGVVPVPCPESDLTLDGIYQDIS